MSLGIRPEMHCPAISPDVTLEGEVQAVEQLGHETQIHIQIPAIRQNCLPPERRGVLVEEGATFAIVGLPPERAIYSVSTACRRLHKRAGACCFPLKKREPAGDIPAKRAKEKHDLRR